MIHSVKKLPNDRFLINDSIVLYDLDFDDEGVVFKIDYDEKMISEAEATEISQKFVQDALENAVEHAKSVISDEKK